MIRSISAIRSTSARLAICAAALASLAGTASAASYTYASVDNSSGPYASAVGASINNVGQVLVEWRADDNGTVLSLYTGAASRVIASSSAATPPANYFVTAYGSLNDNGQVAYFGSTIVGAGVRPDLLRDTAGAKQQIDTFTTGYQFGNGTDINRAGVVAYKTTQNGVGQIRRSNGTIAASYGNDGFTNFLDPVINNVGEVVFKGVRNGQWGVYRVTSVTGVPGNIVTTIASDAGPIRDVFSGPLGLNDAGQAAFSATLDDGSAAVYVGSGSAGGLTKIADTGGVLGEFYFASINNAGQVAFWAFEDDGTRNGVYVANVDGTGLQRVVGTGDAMFGSTIVNASIRNDALNDLGQIVFNYRLANGLNGVGVATVAPVPEPATLALAAAAAAFTLVRRRRI